MGFVKLKGRRNNRIVAFQFCYKLLILNTDANSFIKESFEDERYDFDKTYAWQLIEGVCVNLFFLKNQINKYLKKEWTFERLNYQDQAILLVASYELFFTNCPNKIIINEAIEIAKKYSDVVSAKYINGVMDKMTIKNKKETLLNE